MSFLRLILAMIVVITHTSTPINFLHISGTEAVICFYVVSGYLIARVIRKVYKNNIIGFYKNRFLKVFPYYWIILFFSIICFIFIPTGHHNPLKLFSKLSLSNNFETVFYSIVSNSTIMFADFSRILVLNNNLDLNFKSASTEGLSGAHNLLLIPQSWTLAIELLFYAMAPFVVKNIKTTLSLLTLLLVFEKIVTQKMTFIRFLDNESISVFQIKYFLIGALTYQLSNIFPERIFLLKFPKILLIFLIFYVANYKDELILLSGLLALLLPFLNSTTENSKIRTIGELSYPVYLIHYPIAKYVEDHVIAGYQFYVTTIISIAISMYLVRIFGPYLEDLRKRNRHQNGV